MSYWFALIGLLQPPLQVPSGDSFAESIAAGRDLNGDRIPDLVIGDTTSFDGVDVWFVSGRDGSVLRRREVCGVPETPFVEFLDDVDHDGVTEIASVLAPVGGCGRVEILSGRDASVLRTIRGEDLDLSIGRAHRAGNIDGDGIPDLIVCGSGTSPSGARIASVFVLSGKDSRVIVRVEGDGEARDSTIEAAASVGDLDQDARDDFAVIWRGAARGTRVVLYSGRTGSQLRVIDVEAVDYDRGYCLDGGVDFDRDSLPDILVGSPGTDLGLDARGFVRVYSGRDGHQIRSLQGTKLVVSDTQDPWFGECARFFPDVDGDGIAELLVGAPEEGLVTGAAYLCSGKSGAILRRIEGRFGPFDPDGRDRGEYHVGRALATAGDVDRDGVEDIAVAAVPYGGSGFGRVRVVSGKTGKLLLSVDRESLLRANSAASTPR